jgi:hypothetical protein
VLFRSVLVVLPMLAATQSGSGEWWFEAVVLTVFAAFPWAVLTAALGAVLYLAGRSVSPIRAEENPDDATPFRTEPGADGG